MRFRAEFRDKIAYSEFTHAMTNIHTHFRRVSHETTLKYLEHWIDAAARSGTLHWYTGSIKRATKMLMFINTPESRQLENHMKIIAKFSK